MALGDLLKKLYKKKDELKKRKLDEDVYDASNLEQPKDNFDRVEDSIIKQQGIRELTEEQESMQKSKMVVFGGIFVFVLLAIFVVVFIYFKVIGSAFLEEKVEVAIYGPSEVRSAEDVVYTIKVENFNRIDLRNVYLKLNYSESLVIQENSYIQQEGFKAAQIVIGDIKAKEKKEFEIVFKPFGPRDRQVFLNTVVRYQPINFNSEFEKTAQKSIVIKSSPITITLLPVKKAANGEKVHLDVIVKNNSEMEFENLELKLDYPDGFTFEDSFPSPARDKNVWQLEDLENKEQVKIEIEGILEGMPDSRKSFKAQLGERRTDNEMLVFTENEGITQMISSRVDIRQVVEKDSFYPGEEVRYSIYFKNTSDVSLRDLILMQHVDATIIDKSKVTVPNGYYNSGENTVLWKASEIPTLKLLLPGEEGMVTTAFPIISEIPMNNGNDKNFTVSSYVDIESLDIDSPLWQNKRIRSTQEISKINSRILVGISGLYYDEEIPNIGPTPLVVGEETTFTMHLKIKNTSNDLKNAILTTKLPAGIIWKGKYSPHDAGIEFNERTNELKLIIGAIEAGTGFISPIKDYAFQVGVIPSANQIGQRIYVLNDLEITAVDTFTENEVSYTFDNFKAADVEDAEFNLIDKD